MFALFSPRRGCEASLDQGKIDQYFRTIGWWGVALAIFGIAMLIFTVVSFPSE